MQRHPPIHEVHSLEGPHRGHWLRSWPDRTGRSSQQMILLNDRKQVPANLILLKNISVTGLFWVRRQSKLPTSADFYDRARMFKTSRTQSQSCGARCRSSSGRVRCVCCPALEPDVRHGREAQDGPVRSEVRRSGVDARCVPRHVGSQGVGQGCHQAVVLFSLHFIASVEIVISVDRLGCRPPGRIVACHSCPCRSSFAKAGFSVLSVKPPMLPSTEGKAAALSSLHRNRRQLIYAA
jgi:hypothetical protein